MGNKAVHAGEDDAYLLRPVLNIVGRTESELGIVGKRVRFGWSWAYLLVVLQSENGDENRAWPAMAVRMKRRPSRGLGPGERIARDDAFEHVRVGHEHAGAP